MAIAPTGDARIDDAIARTSTLVALRSDEPVLPVALIARAESDRLRIDDVLRSFGYYDAVIDMWLDGVDLADPALAQRLAIGSAGRATLVSVRIDTGPLYRLAEVGVDGDLPAAIAATFALRAGEPAEARGVLAAGTALRDALRDDGFALARVSSPLATVDHRTRTMDVLYVVESGPRVAIGTIEFTGLERLTAAFARRRLGLAPGDPFSPSRLEQARRDLVSSPAVASARIIPATVATADARLPLRIAVVEAKRRTIRIAGAFATEDGASLLLGWTHRNLFGGAEQLSVRGEFSGFAGGRSADTPDYAAGLSLRLPDRWRRDQDLALDLGVISESLTAYDRDALTLGGALEQRLTPRLSVALGVAAEDARIAQDGQTADFRLLSIPFRLNWDSTANALAPRQGWRLRMDLTPVPWVRGDAEPFARARLTAAGFFGLAGLGRSRLDESPKVSGAPDSGVIASRVALGSLLGETASDVPPDWRFYAGGAGSVRGYPEQSIGPRTARDDPAGGDLLLEASVELRRRIRGPWGMVAFVDGGLVSADRALDLGGAKLGVGLGVRFHTVIGPLRADLAVPLDPYPGDASVQFYLGIGEAF